MDFNKILDIMSELRGKNGCPWDKEQTRESLKPFLVEETYEVIEAIDSKNPEALKEELGDLLFQIVFQCQIARENNEFDMPDVIEKICTKMTERHPHVFGDAEYKTSAEVLVNWENQKKLEGKRRESVIDGIPQNLPPLLRAHRLQDRASRVGFDWERIEDVVDKLEEEVREFKEAYKNRKKDEIEHEIGDIFFAMVNICRFAGVSPEDSLRNSIGRFTTRFRFMESKAANQGKRLSDMSLEEMDALWNEAKAQE